MNFSLPAFGGGLGGLLARIFVLLTVIVHIGFAISVWADAANMLLHQRRSTFLVGGTFGRWPRCWEE